MRKLPKDRHGNEGWAVRARKPHRCEWRGDGCKGIAPGDWYYRAVAWPHTDVNTGNAPWILLICRDCLTDERRMQFDARVEPVLMPTPNQSVGGRDEAPAHRMG